LTVMKWEKRKGWDVLLKTYFQEFSADDDVALYIRANMDETNKGQYDNFVKEFLTETSKDAKELPPVVFLKEQVPYTKLPMLYKAVDCLVLPTHGEGWGLPIIEAMSMELPTIATNWSGNTEFMTEENSYLIPVDEMVESPVVGHFWAQPSLTALKLAMRNVYENRLEAALLGKRARQDIKSRYSVDKVAEIVLDKLSWIEDAREELLSLKAQHKEEMKQKKKQEEERKKGKNQIKIVEDV